MPENKPSAYQLATKLLGKNEGTDHAALTDYLKTGGVNLDPRQLAWCAALVNSSLQQSGLQGTGSNMARSFLNWGRAVETPSEGDIAVFKRGSNPTQGHVGFFQGVNPDGSIRILGGNQGGAAQQGGGVTITSMPASELLGYRAADPNAVRSGTAVATASPTTTAPPAAPEQPKTLMDKVFGSAKKDAAGDETRSGGVVDALGSLATALAPKAPSAAVQALNTIDPTRISADPLDAARPQQAQQMLAGMLADRRKRYGLSLMG